MLNVKAHLLILECDVKGSLRDDLTHTVLALVSATSLIVHLHLCRRKEFVTQLQMIAGHRASASLLCFTLCLVFIHQDTFKCMHR